jgi:hypothetical protein
MDADHVPPREQNAIDLGGGNGTAMITLYAIPRESTLRNDPDLPLVINPYPAVAHYTP